MTDTTPDLPAVFTDHAALAEDELAEAHAEAHAGDHPSAGYHVARAQVHALLAIVDAIGDLEAAANGLREATS